MKTLLFGAQVLVGLFSIAGCSPGGATPHAGGTGGSGSDTASGAGESGGTYFGAGGDTVTNFGGFTSTDGGSTGAGGDACGTSSYQSQLLPSNILFVVDRSGSMNCNLTTSTTACEAHPVAVDAAQPTRWSSIVGGIGAALDELAKVPNTSVGLTFFSNDDVCGATSTPNVGLEALTSPQVDALKNALANGSPKGGTPIIGATILGFKYLHQTAQAPGNRFVVLVTDGADSCITSTADGGSAHATYADQGITGNVVDRLLDTELPKARQVNIRTFVIGAPGSEPGRGLLSKIAFAGDTAKSANCDHASDNPEAGAECHFDMTRSTDFGKDLSDALKKITGQAVTCEYDVPTAPNGKTIDPDKLNVDYYRNGGATDADRVELFRDDTCASGSDGWQYTDPTAKTRIQLCGPACDTIRADLGAKVQVSISCAGQRLR